MLASNILSRSSGTCFALFQLHHVDQPEAGFRRRHRAGHQHHASGAARPDDAAQD